MTSTISENNYFPIIFGRRGGEKFEVLKTLLHTKTQHHLVLLLNKINESDIMKYELVDDLHLLIRKERNNYIQKLLLNFKRDFFNGRAIQKYDATIKKYEPFYKKFETYLQQVKTIELERSNFKQIFNENLFDSIEQLKNITSNYFFQNGLLFSSDILSTEMSKFDFKCTSLDKKKENYSILF